MSRADRVATMAEKLGVYARRAGVDDVDLVTNAYHLAVRPRLALLPDVFHHDMLHPARSALILLEQAGCKSARVLAAAQVTETLLPELRVPAAEVSGVLGADVAALAGEVPDPGDEETLVERLVTAGDDAALIALAERLDHARHLHMRAPSLWQRYHEQTVSVYLPLAQRLNEDIFRRFDRWARAFQRRLP